MTLIRLSLMKTPPLPRHSRHPRFASPLPPIEESSQVRVIYFSCQHSPAVDNDKGKSDNHYILPGSALVTQGQRLRSDKDQSGFDLKAAPGDPNNSDMLPVWGHNVPLFRLLYADDVVSSKGLFFLFTVPFTPHRTTYCCYINLISFTDNFWEQNHIFKHLCFYLTDAVNIYQYDRVIYLSFLRLSNYISFYVVSLLFMLVSSIFDQTVAP